MIWKKTVQICSQMTEQKLKRHMEYATTVHDRLSEEETRDVERLLERLKETENRENEKQNEV